MGGEFDKWVDNKEQLPIHGGPTPWSNQLWGAEHTIDPPPAITLFFLFRSRGKRWASCHIEQRFPRNKTPKAPAEKVIYLSMVGYGVSFSNAQQRLAPKLKCSKNIMASKIVFILLILNF